MNEPTNGTKFRLDNLERRVGKLEDQDVAVMATELRYLKDDVREVQHTLTWILRGLFGLGATIIAGAVLYAITNGAA